MKSPSFPLIPPPSSVTVIADLFCLVIGAPSTLHRRQEGPEGSPQQGLIPLGRASGPPPVMGRKVAHVNHQPIHTLRANLLGRMEISASIECWMDLKITTAK